MIWKTEFELECASNGQMKTMGCIQIVGTAPKDAPYIAIHGLNQYGQYLFVKDKDLERFAVNILKALKSNRLKT